MTKISNHDGLSNYHNSFQSHNFQKLLNEPNPATRDRQVESLGLRPNYSVQMVHGSNTTATLNSNLISKIR